MCLGDAVLALWVNKATSQLWQVGQDSGDGLLNHQPGFPGQDMPRRNPWSS